MPNKLKFNFFTKYRLLLSTVILLFFNISLYCFPSAAIDSLKKVLPGQTGIKRVSTLNELSYEYYHNKPDSGVIYGEEAVALAQKLKNKRETANAMTSLSSSYWVLGNNPKALNLLFSALKTFEELKDSSRMAVVLQNIAVIYDYQKDYDNAMKYYMRELNLSEKRGTATALSYYNIGDFYNGLGQYDNAMKFFKKAIEKGNDPDIECFAVYSIGTIYEADNDRKSASEYFKKAVAMADKITGNIRTKAYIYLHYGTFQGELKQYKSSLKYLSEGLALAREMNEKKLLMDYYEKLGGYYSETGNYKKAYDCLVKHSEIQDSLFVEENNRNMLEMEAKYEAGKRESQITLLTKDKVINQTNLRKANAARNYLIAISVLIIISSLLIYIIKTRSIRRLKDKQAIINEQNIKLEAANKALEDSRSELEKLNRDLEAKVNEEVTKREMQQVMLMQKSKLESLGIFSAGIAHEINQPLTSISFTIENIIYKKSIDKLTDDYLENKFRLVNEDISRITAIINHIRTFAREQNNLSFERFSLNEVVTNSQLIVNTQMKSRNIIINLVLDEQPVYVLGNKYRLEQVLINLIINARYAVENRESREDDDANYKKTICINTYNDSHFAILSVEDNGTGMSSEVKNKIFEPFFTTKDPQNGTGLGLSIVYGIVKEHKGEITVESVLNEYTRFLIKIPFIKQEIHETA
jgi:signal transduction histidine kinase